MSREILDKSTVKADLFQFSEANWAKIGQRIAEVDLHAFGDPSTSTIEKVSAGFSKPNFEEENLITVVLYAQDGQAIGYSQAEQYWSKSTARIVRTALLPEVQGQGLVGILMNTMEEELRTRGARILERNARTTNGYADVIRRHYKERIIVDAPGWHLSREQFFKIKL